jgi:hypothetical protein
MAGKSCSADTCFVPHERSLVSRARSIGEQTDFYSRRSNLRDTRLPRPTGTPGAADNDGVVLIVVVRPLAAQVSGRWGQGLAEEFGLKQIIVDVNIILKDVEGLFFPCFPDVRPSQVKSGFGLKDPV